MQETAIQYIQTKGWAFKERAGELVLETCPFCQDHKSHFYMKPKDGVYFCHKCQERGNLWTLKKAMGDIQNIIKPAFAKPKDKRPPQGKAKEYHQALLKDQAALSYLTGRSITMESISRFKLGLQQENGTRWLSIPHFQGEILTNVKFRSLPPALKGFKRVPDCKSILFNADCLPGQKEVFITEGEIDAITLVQAGFKNVISGTTGAGNFDPQWIDQLKRLSKIFLCYDPDEKGQKGARSLAKRLGYNRCLNVELPEGQDINDFFQRHDIFEFQALVRQAHKFDLPGVISTDTAIRLLLREKSDSQADSGLLTSWENVNTLIKGFHPGDLIILSAPPKIGKTTFSLQIAWHLAFETYPVLFYCLEMRPERLVRKLIESKYRKEDIDLNDIHKAGREFGGLPLYFAYSFKKQKLDDVLNLIREAIKRYDLKFVFFDNLHFLIRSILNVNEELGQAVQGFKLLAEEMEIPIMAIAQPRKREGRGRDEIMRAEDIKYSNAVHADCDQMIILHRKRVASKAKDIGKDEFSAVIEALDPVTLVRIEAHRYGAGGETLLYFHGEYSRFDRVEPVVRSIP
jgi:twinkle protein